MSRWFLGALIVYAAVGLVVSLTVHVASFFVAPPGGDALFKWLHIGIFPLWFAVVTIAKQLTGGGYAGGQAWARTYWRPLLAGSPDWMRTMTYGFFAYALVNFAIFFLFTARGHGAPKSAGDPPAFVWHGFSGHWMAFYSAGLAIATSAYLRGPGNLTPRCPNGHAVSLMDRYCPQCGQPISGNDAT